MNEKVRPGYVAPVSMPVGVTPNPAASLSWPMSYATTQEPSFERGTVTSATTGTHYDPVRQRGDFSKAVIPLPTIQQPETATGLTKRKREDKHPLTSPEPETIESGNGNLVESPQSYDYEPQKIVTPTNSLQSGKRNHVCDMCGATFTRQHNLKSHFLTHTSSKKEFICADCGSEFRRSHDLKRHQKLHTGEKPFACNVCGRRFARADALGRHTKSSGESAEGCVNSRKSSSDPGLTNRPQDFQLPSPVTQDGQSDRFAPSDESPAAFATLRKAMGSPGDNHVFSHDAMASRVAGTDGGPDNRHTILPPLQTAFGLNTDRPFQNASNSTLLGTQRFGIAPAFEPRSTSTHPISFDRGSMQDPQANNSTLPKIPGSMALPLPPHSTVSLQRYQQLESEHQAAMEHIRRLQSGSGSGSGSKGPKGPSP